MTFYLYLSLQYWRKYLSTALAVPQRWCSLTPTKNLEVKFSRWSKQPPNLRKPASLTLLACLCLLILSTSSVANTEQKLGDSYQQVVANYYAQLRTRTEKKEDQAKNLQAFFLAFSRSLVENPNQSTLTIIANNHTLLERNIDDKHFLSVFKYLLEKQLLAVAEIFYDHAHKMADSYTISRLNYYLAIYWFDAGDWKEAQNYLTRIESRNALLDTESDYATLIFGITLQNQKSHRAAINYYSKLPPSSAYFRHAQLNTAVAYIRQGWWTDAKLAIDSALASQAKNVSDELTNRLYLVLGYNQLQHEFYRNARESFRQIEIESRYADQALLGIGLCALHQGDYVGAINAFAILKNKQDFNLPVLESHLLYAYSHEQLGEQALASAHYEASIALYDQLLLKLAQPGNELGLALVDDSTTQKSSREFNLRINNLEAIIASPQAPKALQTRANLVLLDYGKYLSALQGRTRNQATALLTSYLSQAQYGQTKLFDTLN